MTLTNGSLTSKPGAPGLPAPIIRLAQNSAGFNPEVALGSPVSNTSVAVSVANLASVSVHGLPQEIMDDLARYVPKLELLRYVSRRTAKFQFSRNFRNSGYIHPAHGPSPSGNGSHTHGGGISNSPVINAIRPTEWDVTNWGQVIDVTQGIFGFLQMSSVYWRDSVGALNLLDVLRPSGSGISDGFGRRFAYSGAYKPAYYRFRWSIIDPTDPRGQRITGPQSEKLSVTNEVHPFIPAPPVGLLQTATIDPRFDARRARMWIGSVSRLPR